jgi:hypothetical protein
MESQGRVCKTTYTGFPAYAFKLGVVNLIALISAMEEQR